MAMTNPATSMCSVLKHLLFCVPMKQNLSNDMVPYSRLCLVLLIFLAPQLGHTPSAEVVPTANGHRVLKVIQTDGTYCFFPKRLHRAGRPSRGSHLRAHGSSETKRPSLPCQEAQSTKPQMEGLAYTTQEHKGDRTPFPSKGSNGPKSPCPVTGHKGGEPRCQAEGR